MTVTDLRAGEVVERLERVFCVWEGGREGGREG